MAAVIPDRPHYGHRIWSSKEGYDLVAPVYDEWYWRPFWLRNEVPYIAQLTRQISRPQLSLDLGCGTGTYCRVLAELSEVVGIDQSIEMLRRARRNVPSKTKLICGRASAIPLRSGEIDIAVAARSLCHEPNLEEAFRELARVTRDDGVCVVSEVHGHHEYPRTRIALGDYDVHIETFKRTPEEVMDIATSGCAWQVEHRYEIRWKDLSWKPEDERFLRIDRSNRRPIFFILGLRRR